MNRAQRIVLVIGWGLLLAVVARFLSYAIGGPGPDDWFNYAPDSTFTYRSAFAVEGSDWGMFAVWVAAVVLWVIGALLLLRTPKKDRPPA